MIRWTRWSWAALTCATLFCACASLRAQDGDKPKDPAPAAGDAAEEGNEAPLEKTVVPAWEVGDWWKVEYSPLVGTMPKKPVNGPNLARDPRLKETCTFTVEDLKELDGNRCYVIKVAVEGREGGAFQRIYVRQANLTVKLFEEIAMVDGKETPTATANPVKAFFRLESGTTIPFDFPRFPEEEKDELLPDTVGNTNVPLVEKIQYAADKKTVTFEMAAKVNGKEVKSYQKWEAGKPWWVEAKRSQGGVDGEMGKLVDWSGKQ